MLGFYTCENLKISKVEIACYYINVGLQICNFQIPKVSTLVTSIPNAYRSKKSQSSG